MSAGSSYQPVAADFLPLPRIAASVQLSRPSLSYWQDAWRRLKQNPRAMLSLLVVGCMIAGTLVGPLLWRVNPAHQVLDQISQGPNLGISALLVDDFMPWAGHSVAVPPGPRAVAAAALPAPATIAAHGQPSTEAVRFSWAPVAGATGYAVYRHELPPGGSFDLGLPLGEVQGAGTVSFEDRLGLEARRYFYSVVPLLDTEEGPAYITLEQEVRQAIAISEARYRGLVTEQDGDAPIGQEVRLVAHPLGTDYLGRDILARIIQGARTSLFIGITAPFLYVLFGLCYGGVSGFFGGRIDNAMMRFADFVIALPFLLFMILFKVAFGIGPGESGVMPMLIALILLGWPASARLVRGQVLQIREEAYIQAARLMGAGASYLIFRHMLPNVMGVLLVALTFAVPSAIFTEAFLSFIGMGVVPPTPSWGSMCNDGIRTMLAHPHELIAPAAFISITVLAFNLLGDGLRDALDARLRSR
ncbi:MAG: ABC transporter permease [Pseudomonadales bacterium]|nr:ABC transporter permease [Pseudomonadales bacterium]